MQAGFFLRSAECLALVQVVSIARSLLRIEAVAVLIYDAVFDQAPTEGGGRKFLEGDMEFLEGLVGDASGDFDGRGLSSPGGTGFGFRAGEGFTRCGKAG